jgi:hypothetical protein
MIQIFMHKASGYKRINFISLVIISPFLKPEKIFPVKVILIQTIFNNKLYTNEHKKDINDLHRAIVNRNCLYGIHQTQNGGKD